MCSPENCLQNTEGKLAETQKQLAQKEHKVTCLRARFFRSLLIKRMKWATQQQTDFMVPRDCKTRESKDKKSIKHAKFLSIANKTVRLGLPFSRRGTDSGAINIYDDF